MSSKLNDLEFEKELLSRLLDAEIDLKRCEFCNAPLIFLRKKDGSIAALNISLKPHPYECSGLQRRWERIQNGPGGKPTKLN